MSWDDARAMWARGSYAIVGDWFAEASRDCLEGLDLEGRRLLDVACGTGSVAIAAAAAGADVVALDITPSMLTEARRRADALGVAVDWREGSFSDLSAYRGFDAVTSGFGVIFADDPAAVAGELVAACRPGGRIAATAWAPDGAFGRPPQALLDQLPEAAGISPWAERDTAAELATSAGAALDAFRRATVTIGFASAADAVNQMLAHSGPWQVIAEALEARGALAAAREAMIGHLGRFARPASGGIALEVDYVVARWRVPG
ncbi:MAG: class I SAM-dependent methyltransferase [Sandaracinaceae bacterium]